MEVGIANRGPTRTGWAEGSTLALALPRGTFTHAGQRQTCTVHPPGGTPRQRTPGVWALVESVAGITRTPSHGHAPGQQDGDAAPVADTALAEVARIPVGLAYPADGDTPLFHELKRRLAASALAAADRGVVERAVRVLDELATRAASEKVRAAAARDLLRCFAAFAEPVRGPAQRNTLNVVVTAADLVGRADPDTLRLAMEAVRRARLTGGTPGGPGAPPEGSVPGAPPGVGVYPSASATGERRDRPPVDVVPVDPKQPVAVGGQGAAAPPEQQAHGALAAEAAARLARMRAAVEPNTCGTGDVGGKAPW